MTDKIVLPRVDDMHCHFRTGHMLRRVLPETARYAGRAIAMPNTRPQAVLTAEHVCAYRDEIERALDALDPRSDFAPLMTIEIRDTTTPKMVFEAYRAGAVAGKVYPLGVTTNSDKGLREFFSLRTQETFCAMAKVGMLLLIHGEVDARRTLVTRREHTFLPMLEKLVLAQPNLKIVLEHVSTEDAIRTVAALPDTVAATITAHHLQLTLNDVIGDGFVRTTCACRFPRRTRIEMHSLMLPQAAAQSFSRLGQCTAREGEEGVRARRVWGVLGAGAFAGSRRGVRDGGLPRSVA